MDDIGSAISGFLSKPGAMEQLEAMAKQLGLGGPGGQETSAGQSEERQEPDGLPDGLSPEKLQGILRAVKVGGGEDDVTKLLGALKPLLQSDRQEKLDRAIRAVHLMKTAKTVAGTIEL